MESEFERELAESTAAMTAARSAFAEMVAGMADEDLERARRGQWDVAQVLDHVVQSDGYYRRLIAPLPVLRVVVLLGLRAADAWAAFAQDSRLDSRVFHAPHPSPKNLNTRPDARAQILETLRGALNRARSATLVSQ